MLVLKRHENEEVVIGDGIRVVVIEIQNNAVRLGFVAPQEVEVDRAEVWETKQRGKRGCDGRKETR